jgi:serine/threonine protein kinase
MTCNDIQLRELLTSAGDDRAAEQHLASCPRCQSRLSELAADASDWQEAPRLLKADKADAALATEIREREHPPWHSWSSELCATDSDVPRPAWTEAMARQLLAPPSHPEMLGRLGRYEIERLIGSGGMGIVFKAFDTELNRPVAIKVLAPHLAGNGAARQRFSREARAAAAVVHEHVVAIHNVESGARGTGILPVNERPDHGQDGRATGRFSETPISPFLVMQFVAGESLQGRLDRQGPLAVQGILRIAHQTAAGLAAAHAQGLVHRDVKPSNILLEAGVERALLTDFGLARAADDASLTHTGYLPGTPHYMSPEQARGDCVDARSDLFSLGSVLYAMCTGRPPFRADTTFGVLRRITDTQPRPICEINPDIPAWLAALIDRLLAKDPAARLATASETADLLKQCLAHVQQPSAVPLPEICRVGYAHRNSARRIVIGLVASAALVLCAAAALFWSSQRAATRVPGFERSSHPENGSPAAHANGLSPAELDWNAAADEITALSSKLDAFEQRAEELWDQQPTPLPAVEDQPAQPSEPTPAPLPESTP